MIRLLFVLFVTLGGFAAAALWNSRDRDGRDLAQRVVPPELRAAFAAEVDRLGLPEATARLQAAKADAIAAHSGLPARIAETADEMERSEAGSNSSAVPSPQTIEALATPPEAAALTSETEPGAHAHGGAGGALAPYDADAPEREVDDEFVTPPAEFARDLGHTSDVETNTELVIDVGRADVPDRPLDTAAHDSDRSARLIRRMLALYRSTGANR